MGIISSLFPPTKRLPKKPIKEMQNAQAMSLPCCIRIHRIQETCVHVH